ncbi:MAG: hypothetical protein M9887_12250 [Chitinophagales bacterium]|nr:hypothetical protein [Chitinophagales bacterium]
MSFIEKLSSFAGKTFAFWVILLSVIAYLYPEYFIWIKPWIPYLLGIIMFGMGLTLSFHDFKQILHAPKSALIGSIAQYTIMPTIAFLLAKAFHLTPELAAI